MQVHFPSDYSFLPESYVLPGDESAFKTAFSQSPTSQYIIKPDGGSLGAGITILDSLSAYIAKPTLSIVQKYIKSWPLNNRKFDLRVYVLVASLDPLEIYVYRNGIARFCADTHETGGLFSQITNTALNKRKECNLDVITRMIVDVFGEIKHSKAEIQRLWDRIDRIIVLTIIAALPYLRRSEPPIPLHCFQLFGFDVLLDDNLSPFLLEVNYRPSLSKGTAAENAMKLQLLTETFQILLPPEVRRWLSAIPRFAASVADWDSFFSSQNAVPKGDGFVMVYPGRHPEEYQQFIDVSMGIPPGEHRRIQCPIVYPARRSVQTQTDAWRERIDTNCTPDSGMLGTVKGVNIVFEMIRSLRVKKRRRWKRRLAPQSLSDVPGCNVSVK
jgi:hypothetical protein